MWRDEEVKPISKESAGLEELPLLVVRGMDLKPPTFLGGLVVG